MFVFGQSTRLFLRHCRSQRNSRNSTPERYPNHDNGFKAVRERHKSPTNGSMDFHHDFQQPKGQRNSGGRSSFSDESDGGSHMMGSIDLSAHNFDIGSGSSDESIPQSTVC